MCHETICLDYWDKKSHNFGMIKNYADVIDLWESYDALASDVGATVYSIRKWRQRDSIPPEYWRALVESAAKRGIAVVTLEVLAGFAANRRLAA